MGFGTSDGGSSSGENWSGGSSSGSSSSSSNSQSSSFRDPAFVWGEQAPWLEGLYSQAGQLAQNFQGNMGQAQGVYDQAMGGFNRLMNPGVNPQLQAYSGEVQRNLERNLLPAIQGQAGQFGQMGGSRQGIAEGLAVGDSNRQITDMAANLYNADMNRMGQAMSQAPSLGTFGQQIPWYAMNQYSGILGDPTVMQGAAGSQSTASSSSSSEQSGEQWGYGYDSSDGGDSFDIGIWPH